MTKQIIRTYQDNTLELVHLAIMCLSMYKDYYKKYLQRNHLIDLISARTERYMAYTHMWDLCVTNPQYNKIVVPALDNFRSILGLPKGTIGHQLLIKMEQTLFKVMKLEIKKDNNKGDVKNYEDAKKYWKF